MNRKCSSVVTSPFQWARGTALPTVVQKICPEVTYFSRNDRASTRHEVGFLLFIVLPQPFDQDCAAFLSVPQPADIFMMSQYNDQKHNEAKSYNQRIFLLAKNLQ
jgi:hypothetical protein